MTTIQKHIADFLDVDALLPEQKEEILIRVGALVYQNVIIRALEVMLEVDQDEFEKMLDKKARPDEIFNFLNDKVPGLEEIIKEEAEKLKNKSSGIMDKIG